MQHLTASDSEEFPPRLMDVGMVELGGRATLTVRSAVGVSSDLLAPQDKGPFWDPLAAGQCNWVRGRLRAGSGRPQYLRR
jgi:hypothetical protein